MGVEELSKTIIAYFPHLTGDVPPEAVNHSEPVDIYHDIMTRLMAVASMLSEQYPNGVTGRDMYDRMIIPVRDMIATRTYAEDSPHVHLITICADKQIYVPKKKGKLQAKRNESREKKEVPMLDADKLYQFDDQGMYSQLERIFADDPLSVESKPFNPLSVMMSRAVRLELYHYFWRAMQDDNSLWPVNLKDASVDAPVVWGPRLRFVFDFDPDLSAGAHVMEIDSTGTRHLSRLPENNRIGEGENSVIWHLRRNWVERGAVRISIHTTDQDMCALLVMHFWFYDLSLLKTFLWHRNDFKLHSAFHIPHVIEAFRKAGWTRPRFAALCTLLGSDYAERIPGVGAPNAREAAYLVNREYTKQWLGEVVAIPDVYVPLRITQFSMFVSELIRYKWPSKNAAAVNALVKEHLPRLHGDYVWQTQYWFELYEPREE